MLCTLLDRLGNTWEELLPHVQFNMNSAYVLSLGVTPFEALFGFTPLKPIGLVQNVHCPHPTAAEFATLFDTYNQRARDAIRTAQLKLVEKMDQGRKTTKSYQVGDSVWLLSTHYGT